MQLPDSILPENFSTDFIVLWHGHTVALRALTQGGSPGRWGQFSFVLWAAFVQPDVVWSLCWLQHCRSTEAAPSSAFPLTVLHWNPVDGLKDSALEDNSLSSHKPGLRLGSLWSPSMVLAVVLPSGMETNPMGSLGRGCNRPAGGSQDGQKKY